jgi:hypothetical protein
MLFFSGCDAEAITFVLYSWSHGCHQDEGYFIIPETNSKMPVIFIFEAEDISQHLANLFNGYCLNIYKKTLQY